MIEKTPPEDHRRLATLWRVTVESWLRRQGLICVRQTQGADCRRWIYDNKPDGRNC